MSGAWRGRVELLNVDSESGLVTSNHVRGETWTFLRLRADHRAAFGFLDAMPPPPGCRSWRQPASRRRRHWAGCAGTTNAITPRVSGLKANPLRTACIAAGCYSIGRLRLTIRSQRTARSMTLTQ